MPLGHNPNDPLSAHVAEVGKIKKPPVSAVVPKADMHGHLSLAHSVEMFVRRVKHKRTALGPDFLLERDRRYYDDLTQHHNTYESLRTITNTPQELAQVAQTFFERTAREGGIYIETSNSFRNESDFEWQMEAIHGAIDAAKANFGITTRIVATSLRNAGHEHAEKAARYLARNKNRFPYVTGFGLVGEENVDAFSSYKTALAIAFNEAGLGLAPHVSEQHPHNAVEFFDTIPREAFDIKETDSRRLRVGHGTLVHMSSELIKRFADHNVCFEALLSANKRIDLPAETRAMQVGHVVETACGAKATLDQPLRRYFKDLTKHPIKDFIDAGIPVCLGSDNPLLMDTNIGKEYSQAYIAGVTDWKDTLQLTRNAIKYANIDFVERVRLNGYLDRYDAQMKTGQPPKTTALGYHLSY